MALRWGIGMIAAAVLMVASTVDLHIYWMVIIVHIWTEASCSATLRASEAAGCATAVFEEMIFVFHSIPLCSIRSIYSTYPICSICFACSKLFQFHIWNTLEYLAYLERLEFLEQMER